MDSKRRGVWTPPDKFFGDGWALCCGFCWVRFIVALQVSDVLSDCCPCVLSCSQFSLNLLVQSPDGIRG
jgi:hypothetical protein